MAPAALRYAADDHILARQGPFEVRLAASEAEVRAAQQLRHEVFRTEAQLPPLASGIEADRFDPFCDHIIVCDRSAKTPEGRPPVVGTYRALRSEAAVSGFYSDAEFDLAQLFGRHPHLRFCEVGRSCVAQPYRALGVLDALWRGLFVYAARHGIDVYFGVASFPGTDPRAHAMALSWLCHHEVGGPAWHAEARSGGAVPMDLVAPQALDRRLAMRQMPALVRGYLQIGAHIGRTAFVDPVFGTIDVLVVAPLADAPRPWRRRFEPRPGPALTSRV
ncbi:GNAT family N-acetyltransferase [Pelagibacterium limicola]|uniref:GNAT family N-acetyltransferase n=1 Tax=Pelagibacterium limicola TaxID=2791022 RepID=UPI0018AFAFEF|nr:GNAT family N-acyltransferase [Pelagibacterium limicola]